MRLVQWSRFSDAFQRLFGLQGASQLNVVDDCFLTLPVEQELLHLANLRGWTPFAARLTTGPVAGQFASCRISPAGGQLMVIEGADLFAGGGIQANAGLLPSLGGSGGVTAQFARDARRQVVAITTATANNVGQVITIPAWTGTPAANTTTRIPMQFVLTPGTDLVVEAGVANQQLWVSFWGMYRELTSQEQ